MRYQSHGHTEKSNRTESDLRVVLAVITLAVRSVSASSTMPKPSRTIRFAATAFSVLVALAVVPAQTAKRAAGGKQRAGSRKPAPPSWPSFDARRADWIRRKQAASESGAPGPDPLQQYLIDEIIVTGVYDADKGYGLFLYAKPTGNTFFSTPGALLYNGRLAEIRPSSSGFVEEFEIVFMERAPKGGAERRVTKQVEPAPGPTSTETP
jgi:hypothetical protein